MTLNEKLNYIIQVLNQITNNSKNIGELEVYEPNNDESENLVAVFSTIDGKTRRANINELFAILTGAVPPHTHSYNEINGLGAYKKIILEDSNLLEWKVERLSEDETDDSFKTNDEISGFIDVAKTTYYHGLVLVDGFIVPDDLEDKNKFFKIDKIIRI